MGSLALLSARGLWLAAGVAPILLLYVLKSRRSRARVSSTWLWREAQRDARASHPWRRLTGEIPLLLEILAVLALALALARPASRGAKRAGDHVAIVIDTSASMLAVTGPAGGATRRIDEAKRIARETIGELAPEGDAIVVEAGRDARAVTPLDRDRRALIAAIDRVDAREVEGDLAAGVALAADRLRPLGGARRIVILTDGALAHDAKLTTGGIDAAIVTVGDDAENAGIVRIDARRGIDPASGRDEVQVFVGALAFGDHPREGYVTLAREGEPSPRASRRVQLTPGSVTPVVLSFEPRDGDEGAGLVVRLSPGDALPADDVAYARVPGGRAMPVVLASDRASSWVGRALAADAEVDLRVVPLAALASADVDPDALVVVEGGCPASLPGRDVLIVAPGEGDCLGVHVGAALDQPRVTSWDTGDPRLRFVTLDGLHVARARTLGEGGSRGALVQAGTATLVRDASSPGRTATVVGFEPSDSDWPLQASFVLFVRDVVEVARGHRALGGVASARTGEPIRLSLPPGVARALANEPGGDAVEVEVRDGFALVSPPDHAGLLHLRWTAPRAGEVVLPVNLTSAQESSIRPRLVSVDGTTEPRAEGASLPPARREWGAWLALLAALAVVIDAAWLTRRGMHPATAERASRAAPAVIAVVCALPLAYEALVRVGAVSDRFARVESATPLVLLAIGGAFLAHRFARAPSRLQGTRRALFAGLEATALIACALAASGLELGAPIRRLTVLMAVDRSRSIDLVPGGEARVGREITTAERGMRDGDRVGTVVFGAEAALLDPPRSREERPSPQQIAIGRDGTDIEAAIRGALSALPSDTAARIVLLTDGVETRGDALAGAAAAEAAGVPVDALLLDQKPSRDVRIASVGAPDRVDRDEPFDLRVVTESAVATDVELRILCDGAPMARVARAHVAAGQDVLRVRKIAPDAGFHRYDVEVTALDPSADTSPEDNAASAFVRVRGPATALVLEGDAGPHPIRSALEAAGFAVTERSLAGAPADAGELAPFDLVTLADIRAADLTPGQLEALAAYVRDAGGGLLLFGGDRAMGPGGYARTPIEEISPVSFDLKNDQRRASLAEVIAIDYSGSMGMVVSGQTKLALANEAAARSAELLGRGDRLGVEHVDTSVAWTIPLGPVSDPSAIGARIRRVGVGGGGIYTDLALRAGFEALSGERVNLKHLLLFADGDDAEQIAGCRAIVHDAAARGVTTSVISLGVGHDTPELEALSREGGGRFYLIDDATKLPAVFTSETILATRSAIHEDPFRVSPASPSAATRGIDFGAAPPLGGYVVTVPKPRATVALTGPDGDPVLAAWSAGLGRAGAFTSDYRDRWGADWLAWGGAATMFGQVARDLARKEGDPRVRLASDASGAELHVRADVVGDDGRAQTFRRLTARVAGPDGFSRVVPLEAVGAGRYAASVPVSRPGAYVATATDEGDGAAIGMTGAVLGRGEELRPTGSDRALLARITALTGGKMLDTLDGVFEDRAARRFAYTSLTPLLTILAAIAVVLAVAARKLVLPERLARLRLRAGPAVAAHAPVSPPPFPRPPPTPDARADRSPAAPASNAAPPAAAPRPLTSAERLAEKRRQRRS